MTGNEVKITSIPYTSIILVLGLLLKHKLERIAPGWRLWTFQEECRLCSCPHITPLVR